MTAELQEDFRAIDWLLCNPQLESFIAHFAAERRLTPFDLRVRALLHLPRFQWDSMVANEAIIRCEVERLADVICEDMDAITQRLGPAYDLSDRDLAEEFVLELPPPAIVEMMIGRQHYLRSIRDDAIQLGLKHEPTGRFVGVISVSPFDLEHLPIEPDKRTQVRVLSRIFTVDNLPKNTPSRFIGLAKDWIRQQLPEVGLLLTYLNTNLGFSGVVYRASNWLPLFEEHGTRYAYFQGNYVTDRFLSRRFGTALAEGIPADSQVCFSQMPLRPLTIYSLALDNKAHAAHSARDVFIKRF